MYCVTALTNIKRILKKYRKEYKEEEFVNAKDGPMQTLVSYETFKFTELK